VPRGEELGRPSKGATWARASLGEGARHGAHGSVLDCGGRTGKSRLVTSKAKVTNLAASSWALLATVRTRRGSAAALAV